LVVTHHSRTCVFGLACGLSLARKGILLISRVYRPLNLAECFQRFGKYKGPVPVGYSVNFLGAKSKDAYTTDVIRPLFGASTEVETQYPGATEEYFEWVDLLEAVLSAGEQFTFMELGAGFGRWSVNAALASAQLGKSYRIVAIEPEPTHFNWLEQNIQDNGVDVAKCELVEAAMARTNGETEFYIGNPTAWYGQAVKSSWANIITEDMKKHGVHFGRVKTVALGDFLKKYCKVDLIDLDVQYAEFEVLDAAKSLLSAVVKRVHIGTHSHEIEGNLRGLFRGLGWAPKFDFECLGNRQTPMGVIDFRDGVQAWINPALAV